MNTWVFRLPSCKLRKSGSQQANIRAKQERQQQELAEQLLQRYRERFGELPD
ncbi:hypothetical protein [Nostoc sp.]|uniref:hypothetical protein n=1 Tax=Nostoc sp. TaxID=1180 RepID=UPI002FF87720